MSEPEAVPSHIHREATLLPWYVNGTLAESERERVDRHLETCPDCRMELEELTRLRSDLSTIYRAQPGPSSRTSQSIFQAVARDASARRTAAPRDGSALEQLDQWFRSLFVSRWVPTLVATLFLAQIGLFLWVSAPAPDTQQITTRSLIAPAAKAFVAFQHSATEEQIRSLLQALRGRIIDGPTSEGLYTIEMLAADDAAGEEKLKILRGRTDIIRSADPVTP